MTKEPLARAAPPPPTWLAPVRCPKIKIGDPYLVVIHKQHACAVRANKRLKDGRSWYIREVLTPLANMPK